MKAWKAVYKKGTYSRHFASFLMASHRYQCLMGGRGSGKTAHAMYKLLMSSFLSSPQHIYYGRHQMATVRRTTFQDMCNFLEKKPFDTLLKPFFEYSRAENGPMVFTNMVTGHQLRPFGLDDPDAVKGLSEATMAWVDEIDKCTKEQFQAVDSLLRTAATNALQFIFSFNPVSELHWLRNLFFDRDDAYSPNAEVFGESLYLNHSTLWHNEFMDREAYYRTLMRNSMGRQNYINVNIHGLWGVPDNDNPWLYAFDETKHIADDLPLYKQLPVHLSFDFNRKPLTCTAMQKSINNEGKKAFCHIIKEFSGEMQLKDLCNRIKGYFPGKILTVTGDASGNQGDVAFEDKHATYYTQIQKFLGLSSRLMMLNKRNISHNDSQELCNYILFNHPNFKISRQGCPNLINDMMIAEIDQKSKVPNAIRKDRGVFKMDLFDTYRYHMQTHFLEWVAKSNRRKY